MGPPSTFLRALLVLAGCVASFAVFFKARFFLQGPVSGFAKGVKSNGLGLQDASNRTLGFQKVFVVDDSERSDQRRIIDQVAGVTPGGLKIEHVNTHIQALRTIVEQSLQSALILEGDVDWDIRIKSQMRDFARAARLLARPGQEEGHWTLSNDPVSRPGESPYGDLELWDLLWLGHCGAEFVDEHSKVPHGRIIIHDDETVPALQHFEKVKDMEEFVKQYPDHTRVVHRSWKNACSWAYGVSQKGARGLLREAQDDERGQAMSVMLRNVCEGANARPFGNCLTVQPSLFNRGRPAGTEVNGEFVCTTNVRWSVRGNLQKLNEGKTDFVSCWQDSHPTIKAA